MSILCLQRLIFGVRMSSRLSIGYQSQLVQCKTFQLKSSQFLLLMQNQKQWQLIENIFKNKTSLFLQYQAQRFIKQKMLKNKNWSQQEDNLLKKVVMEYEKDKLSLSPKEVPKTATKPSKQDNPKAQAYKHSPQLKNCGELINKADQNNKKSYETLSQNINENARMINEKHDTSIGIDKELQNSQDEQNAQTNNKEKMQWNLIARKMYEYSNKQFFRCAKHCRQRWLNHIDPSKVRGKWSIQQDIMLMQEVKRIGTRWSQLAIKLNRTEHNVKNRYNSLVNNVKRSRLNRIHQHRVAFQYENGPIIIVHQDNDRQKHQDDDKQRMGGNGQQQKEQSDISGIQDLKHLTLINDDIGNQTNGNIPYSPFLSHSPRITGIITPLINEPSPLGFSMFLQKGFASYHRMFDQNLKNQEDHT